MRSGSGSRAEASGIDRGIPARLVSIRSKGTGLPSFFQSIAWFLEVVLQVFNGQGAANEVDGRQSAQRA